MRSKSKHGHRKGHWDIWLRTAKQRLAAFTVCLVLALGIIVGGEAHTHVGNNPPTPTTINVISSSGSGTTTFSSRSGTWLT